MAIWPALTSPIRNLMKSLVLYLYLNNPWHRSGPLSAKHNLPIPDENDWYGDCGHETSLHQPFFPMTELEATINSNESCHSLNAIDDYHRIVNGQTVHSSRRLFQIALLNRQKFFCGGSLISRRFVITAAHCVHRISIKDLKIRYATKRYESGPTMVAHSVFKHPDYSPKTSENDIALIRLAYPLPKIPFFLDRISINQNKSIGLKSNETVIVSGWGRTGRFKPISKNLLMASLKTVDIEECKNKWDKMFKVNTQSMICAAEAERSACNGDSGGPLTLGNKLIGIVSVGSSNCLSLELPNIYTNVAYFNEWIMNTIKNNS
ncbi:Trypsin epsilon [Sarcoptes scabiei]|uniref:Trypsin epsilon n=2 Tax=Sarcoptes scabiei TaxID=52283 RepID=A0A834RA42_SARSC|nr:Trypsin epsilon [Sarcoptes scabiei]